MASKTILITGGTGKTGSRLARRLSDDGVDVRVAARRAQADGGVVFDWSDPRIWPAAMEGVGAVYLVAPPAGGDASATMIDFARQAVDHGVRRFVLLSASLLPAGGPAMGQVHLWLQQNAAEWAVLRPSWFMENFSEGQHAATIRDEGVIYSATQDGRAAFIAADDIAACAAAVLTAERPPNADFILTGADALSYDDVAATLSRASGRTIVHRHVTVEELVERLQSRGLPPAAAQLLAGMDVAIAHGAEDRTTPEVEKLTGARPKSFVTFAAEQPVS